MKIVKNNDWGGYNCPVPGCNDYHYNDDKHQRTDPEVIAAVEDPAYKGDCTVVEIPDGSYTVISDYDGMETVYYSASPIFSS